MNNSLIACFCGLLIGCGGGAGGPDGSAPSTDAMTPPADAMSPPEDAMTPPTDASTGGTQQGNVVISQTTLAVAGMTFTTTAHAAAFGALDTSGCVRRTEGPCTINRCPTAGGDAGAPMGQSAGVITFSGGTGAPIELRPNPDGTYTPNTSMMARWRAGDRVSVRAAGATVPMFDAMLTFPASITVTEPAAMPGTTVRVSRATPLTVRWTAMGTSGQTNVSVVSTGGGSTTIVTCTYPVNAGMAVIPASALSELVPGMGSFSVTATAFQTVMPGSGSVSVAANSTGAAALAMVQ